MYLLHGCCAQLIADAGRMPVILCHRLDGRGGGLGGIQRRPFPGQGEKSLALHHVRSFESDVPSTDGRSDGSGGDSKKGWRVGRSPPPITVDGEKMFKLKAVQNAFLNSSKSNRRTKGGGRFGSGNATCRNTAFIYFVGDGGEPVVSSAGRGNRVSESG